ncbi:unnamed protein product [Microthlaspi erraticum]|uniref:Aspartic peptidase DDI1-type domain-containing protein n=1 Tax=Microthlaspi erraticum TaxID=1685480 RepID=A0A6D2KYR9_9BRAS|nr:unnamed protein product [Microthlaspi erraticum]
MTKSKEGAFELIENLAASSSNKNAEYDRTVSTVSVKGSSADAKKIEELTGRTVVSTRTTETIRTCPTGAPTSRTLRIRSIRLDRTRTSRVIRRAILTASRRRPFAPNQNRSQGNQQKAQFSNQQQPSGSSNNSNDELKGMMQQMLMNQQKSTAETHLKIDTMYNDLNGKYEAVWTHVKKLDVQWKEATTCCDSSEKGRQGESRREPEDVTEVDRAGDDARRLRTHSDLPTPAAAETAPARAYTPKMIPALKKYMKELISGKVAEDENVMLVSEECSAVLQNKIDKFPVGILEDLHVQIGNTLIPADFVVLELDEEPKDPLILGRNFLCTAGAIIDVKGGIIDLHLGDIVMRFEMNKLLKKPMLDGQTYVIEDGSNLVDEVSEEMLLDDPLEVALTKAEGEYDFLNEEADGFGK